MTSFQLFILSSISLVFLTLMNIMQRKQFYKLFKDYLEYKRKWLINHHNWDQYADKSLINKSLIKPSIGALYLLSGSLLTGIFIACYFSSMFNEFLIHELWYIAPLIVAIMNVFIGGSLSSKWNNILKSYQDDFCDGRPFYTEILETFYPALFFFYVPYYITSLFALIYTIKRNPNFFAIPEVKMVGVILVILIAFLLFIKSWIKKT